jgi:PKHD-type hydroxylase
MYRLNFNNKINPVCWIKNFLDDKEIEKILTYSEEIESVFGEIGMKNPKVNDEYSLTNHIKPVNEGKVPRIRRSTIKWIDLNDYTRWLYEKIISETYNVNQENFQYNLSHIEKIQLSEYNQDMQGFYSKHIDCGDHYLSENYVDIRKLSFSIQLSEPSSYDGGDLIIYCEGDKMIAPKSKGTIIFFQSNILHEVKPVNRGVRHSLVSWINGPNLR